MYGCNLARDRVVTNNKIENYVEKPLKTRIQIISEGHPDQVFIGSETSVTFAENSLYDFIKGPEDNGHWRVYKAGELIDEHPSSWNPNQFKLEWFDKSKVIESESKIPPATSSNGVSLPASNKKID